MPSVVQTCLLRGKVCCINLVVLSKVFRDHVIVPKNLLTSTDTPTIFGWTQDDGAMNAGPAHLITDEGAIEFETKNFASSLDDADLVKLLELYSEEYFHPRVDSCDAAKDESDPDVSVHYFRLSQILQDLLFTCSSIDFASK